MSEFEAEMRITRAAELARQAAAMVTEQRPVPPEHFNAVPDRAVAYLGLMMLSHPQVSEAVLTGQPSIVFPELYNGEEHAEGYLGAAALLTARPATVHGRLDNFRFVAPPYTPLVTLWSEYVVSCYEPRGE